MPPAVASSDGAKPAASPAAKALGFLCLVITASIWTGGSFLVKWMEGSHSSSQGGGAQQLPVFVINYVTLAAFILYLPLYWLRKASTGARQARTCCRADATPSSDITARSTGGKQPQEPAAIKCSDVGVDQPEVSIDLSTIEEHSQTIKAGRHPSMIGQPDGTEDWDQLPEASAKAALAGAVATLAPTGTTSASARFITVGCFKISSDLARLFGSAVMIYPSWFLGYLLYMVCLSYTSVMSASIIYTTLSLFSYLLSIALLSERLQLLKSISILCCIGGAVMVITADSGSSKSGSKQALGNILSLASAFTYALYSVLVQRVFPTGLEGDNMMLFFGFMGGVNAVVMLPGTIWYIVKGQVAAWACAAILGKAVANMLAEYLWATALLLLSPSVSSALVVPLNVLIASAVDLALHKPGWLHHTSGIALMVTGVAVILAGFFGLNLNGCFSCQSCCGVQLSQSSVKGLESSSAELTGEEKLAEASATSAPQQNCTVCISATQQV